MNSYGDFATIYDSLMKDVDYAKMIDAYQNVFQKAKLKPKLMLDLACGTGNITIAMAKLGYDMIGVDASVEMLNVARQKALSENLDILFLNQDMREFELYGTVDVVICALDSINYVTEDLDKVFALVKNYLNPGGLFLFDINTPYKLEHIIAENTYVYDDGEIYYTWQSEFEDRLCDFYLTFFVKKDEKYCRFDETHTERAYTDDEIQELVEKYDFQLIERTDGDTFEEVQPTSQRIFYAVRKDD